jgi:fatty acid desaturase
MYVLFEHIFINLTSFKRMPNSVRNIVQNLPHNWIMVFVEVHKELMHCSILFPFFLMYLKNAEYMISS